MKQALTLLMLLAGLISPPLFADLQAFAAGTIMADESGDGGDGGDGGKPPTEEEEEPDCE